MWSRHETQHEALLNEIPPSRLLNELDVLWKLNKSESAEIGDKSSRNEEYRGNKMNETDFINQFRFNLNEFFRIFAIQSHVHFFELFFNL